MQCSVNVDDNNEGTFQNLPFLEKYEASSVTLWVPSSLEKAWSDRMKQPQTVSGYLHAL
jgi:hypothetical protein